MDRDIRQHRSIDARYAFSFISETFGQPMFGEMDHCEEVAQPVEFGVHRIGPPNGNTAIQEVEHAIHELIVSALGAASHLDCLVDTHECKYDDAFVDAGAASLHAVLRGVK